MDNWTGVDEVRRPIFHGVFEVFGAELQEDVGKPIDTVCLESARDRYSQLIKDGINIFVTRRTHG